MITLRPYQTEAIDSLYDHFRNHQGNPLIVLPTGTGKSLCIAAFINQAVEAWPETRVLVLTHVKELIAQNHEELLRLWPLAPAGIYSAGLKRRDLDAPILFAGIQSIHGKAHELGQVDLVLVDEAHLIPRKGQTMYGRFLATLKRLNPMLKIIGLTATPYRMDSGRLDEGEERLFHRVAYDAPVSEMIAQGYLAEVIPRRTGTQLDVSGVGKRGGEFIAGQLERAVNTDEITRSAVQEILRSGEDRQSWLIFCAGVDHARDVRNELRAHDITSEMVLGDTPAPERDRIVEAFKAGEIRALTNANVLTTGFNAPGVDLIAMLRPTQSPGLYVQMVGRGTRTAPGNTDCLVLDFAGNTERHGPIDAITPRAPGEGDGEAPTKDCPECDRILAAATRTCSCGHVFPEPEPKLKSKPSTAPVLAKQTPTETVEVTGIAYHRHSKPSGVTRLRVDYRCGLATHREWVCLDHEGYPRRKAESWWRRRSPGTAIPATVAEGLTRTAELAVPAAITLRPKGRYTEIVACHFHKEHAA
ncbi:MAG: hypothetical protein PsegKO_34840 [Pseudohongiellaceae bacterium]